MRDEHGADAPSQDRDEPPADGPSSGPAGESEETGEASQDTPGGDSSSDGKQSPN